MSPRQQVLDLAKKHRCEVQVSRVPAGWGGYTEITIEPIDDVELEPGLTGWVCHGWGDALARMTWLDQDRKK
jgi:hypothetical protein